MAGVHVGKGKPTSSPARERADVGFQSLPLEGPLRGGSKGRNALRAFNTFLRFFRWSYWG